MTQRISNLVKIMETQFMNEFSIDNICHQVKMSLAVLFREFNRYYNMPPMEYLTLMRLRHACYLLSQSELPVVEIAIRCGFCDHSYFSLQFRRHMKISPLQFRRGNI